MKDWGCDPEFGKCHSVAECTREIPAVPGGTKPGSACGLKGAPGAGDPTNAWGGCGQFTGAGGWSYGDGTPGAVCAAWNDTVLKPYTAGDIAAS